MPNAVATGDTEKFDLKTCPDGFVVLRSMSYGQVLQRRALMKMDVDMGTGKKGSKKDEGMKGSLAMGSSEVNQFEFRVCIVDHNLEDETGKTLNLHSPSDIIKLDPKIGQEIEKRISEMNNFEEDDDLEN
jgi:hypothetical protein